MRSMLIAGLVLLATPAAASAAIGEVEPLTLRGDTDCVYAPGAPGEIVVPATDGVRFVHATREGLKPGATVSIGGPATDCVRAVTTASGAGVLVGRRNGLTVVVRDPGGAWGAPVALPLEAGWDAEGVNAAVSDRGDVLLVWREERGRQGGASTYRFRAARRAPGGAFGPAETIGTPDLRNELILPAIAATGEAFVLTTRSQGSKPPITAPVSVTSAAPGAPFGAPVVLGTMPWLSIPSLVAAPDGRVLVALPDGQSVLVAERAPDEAFGPAVPVATLRASTWAFTSASLGAGGEAALMWVNAVTGDAGLVARAAPGPFGAPQTLSTSALVPLTYDPFFASQSFLSMLVGTGGLTSGAVPFGATALTPGGQAVFAWYRNQAPPAAPALFSSPLAGGPVTGSPTGRGLTTPATTFPVVLADGAAGLAWVDSVEASSRASYRLRFAADGVAARPGPAVPRVTVGAPRSRVLSREATLRLPVRCSGPCEVHGEVTAGLATVTGTLRLARAGTGTLAIRGAAMGLSAPRGRIHIVLSYRAPGGLEAKSRTLRVALARPQGVPDARVRDLRAVRRGGTIRVTWRTADPDPDALFYVTGTRTRELTEEPVAVRSINGRRDRRAYAVTLRAGADVRWVMIRSFESIVSGRPATVRIR